MNFGEALKELKMGSHLYREGWNGIKLKLDIFIVMVPQRYELMNGVNMLFKSYLQMVYLIDEPFTVAGWLASQEDMLSDDWQLRIVK